MTNENFETDKDVQDAFDRLSNDAGKVNAMAALRAHEDQKKGAGWLTSPSGLISGLAFAALLIVGGFFLFNRGETLVESEAPVAAQGEPAVEPTGPIPPSTVPTPQTTEPTADTAPPQTGTTLPPGVTRPVDDDPTLEIPEEELEAAIAEAEATADDLTTTIPPETTVPDEEITVTTLPAEETGGGTGSSFEDLLACSLSTPETSVTETTVTELTDILTFDNGSCRRTVFQFEDGAAIDPDDVTLFPGFVAGVDILYEFELASDFAEIPEDRSAGFSGQAIHTLSLIHI